MGLFHRGEVRIQTALGVHEQATRVAGRMVRDHFTDQHRQFFEQLPFVVLGAREKNGFPSAHLVCGEPGFISADRHHLHIESEGCAHLGLKTGDDVGLLGIVPEHRRRNRASGLVVEVRESTIVVEALQSYGNCPQFISRRRVQFTPRPGAPSRERVPLGRENGDEEMLSLIRKSDTFFIASGHGSARQAPHQGLDVSHRGGPPGFVQIRERKNQLIIPDYAGNRMFNTLGNLLEDPRCGLTFIDPEGQRTLMLRGTARIEHLEATEPGHRQLRFTLDSAMWQAGLPLTFDDLEDPLA